MLKAGIIDPTKVSRCALENAISITGMFRPPALIVEAPKATEPAEHDHGGGGRYGGNVMKQKLKNSLRKYSRVSFLNAQLLCSAFFF